MAAIQQIRKRWKLVFTLIGFAIVAFVLSDLLRSNRSLFQGGKQSNHVGKISGEKISYQQFQDRVNRAVNNFKRRRQTDELSDRMRNRLQDQAWKQLVFSKAFQQEQKYLGIKVTDEELFNMVQGPNPHPSVKKAFQNPKTGEFNRQNLQRFLQRLDKGLPSQASQQQVRRFKQQKKQWFRFEESMVRQRERKKYFTLIKKSFYVTDLEARRDFLNENKTASIGYLKKRYRSVADSAINVSQEALRNYYKNHKEQYKRETPERSIEYVIFDVKPSAKDSARIRKSLKTLAKRFKATNKDSTFVELHSEKPYDSTYQRLGKVPDPIKDSIVNADTGEVFGPYLNKNGYNLTKLIDRKADTVQYFKAKHILFQPNGSTESDTAKAEQRAREIFKKIQQGADFDKMGAKHHEGSSVNLGWFREGRMAKPFEEGVKNHQKGEVFTVNTQFGTHIIKPTAEPVSTKFKLANITAPIYPGDKTYQKQYQKTNEFRASIQKPGEFNKMVRKSGLNRRIADQLTPATKVIPGLSDAGEVVRWAYSNEEGDLSGILELKQQYVVAHLTDVKQKGTKSLSEVKNQIRPKVKEKLKAQALKKEFEKASQSNKNLEAIAQQLNLRVQTAPGVQFSKPMIPGIGKEPAVVGAVFGLEKGMLSPPIKGNKGVYELKLKSVNTIKPPKKLVSTKESIRSNMAAQAQVKAIQALRDMAKVKDLRYRFN